MIIRKRISQAAEKSGRLSENIKLIAVGKTHKTEEILEARNAGQLIFAENYVQELKQKAEALAGSKIEWHFIGHLQRNKVKYIVPFARCIHSLDSIKLAEEIDKRFKSPIDCLIEVNLAGEESKTGISEDEVPNLIEAIKNLDKINLIGLMTMPPYDENPEKSRPYFKKLCKLLKKINEQKLYQKELKELSMGMSEDFEIAIEEGSTMLRIGTAIFGERVYK